MGPLIARRLPYLGLAALIALELALAADYHAARHFTPQPAHHDGHRLVLDLRRQLQGYEPANARDRLAIGRRNAFFGDRGPAQLRPDRLIASLAAGDLRGAWRNDPQLAYWNQTPHAYLWPALAGAAWPWSPYPVALAPQLYLALLLASLFGIARRAARRRGGGDDTDAAWVGLAAAAVASGYPAIAGLARTHHDTLAVGALAAALVYLLLRSDGLRRLPVAAAAGGVAWLATRAGESTATTALAAAIAAGPALVVGVEALRGGLRDRSSAPRRLAGAALVLSPPLLLFEWFRVDALLFHVGADATDTGTHVVDAAGAGLGPVADLAAYAHRVAVDLVWPLMTAWALVGALLLWRAPRGRRLAVLLMFALPFAALSVMGRKAAWYAAPVVPALAVITALGLAGLPGRRLRRGALAAAAACGVATLLYAALAPAPVRERFALDRLAPGVRTAIQMRGFELARPRGVVDLEHQHRGWLLLGALAEVLPRGEQPTVIGVLSPSQRRTLALRYTVELLRDDLLVVDLLHSGVDEHPELRFDAGAIDVLLLEGQGGPPGEFRSFEEMGLAGGGALPPPVRRVLGRSWTRFDTGEGPVYFAADARRTR